MAKAKLKMIDPVARSSASEAAERDVVIELCAKAVPTNWCDALLTGAGAGPTPLDCRDVEKLLRGIQDRIRGLAVPNGERA